MQQSRFCMVLKLGQAVFILAQLSSMAILAAPAIAERIVEIPAVTDRQSLALRGLACSFWMQR